MLGIDEDNHHCRIYALYVSGYQSTSGWFETRLATMRLEMYWYTVAANASPSFRLTLAFTESRLMITCTTYSMSSIDIHKP